MADFGKQQAECGQFGRAMIVACVILAGTIAGSGAGLAQESWQEVAPGKGLFLEREGVCTYLSVSSEERRPLRLMDLASEPLDRVLRFAVGAGAVLDSCCAPMRLSVCGEPRDLGFALRDELGEAMGSEESAVPVRSIWRCRADDDGTLAWQPLQQSGACPPSK